MKVIGIFSHLNVISHGMGPPPSVFVILDQEMNQFSERKAYKLD